MEFREDSRINAEPIGENKTGGELDNALDDKGVVEKYNALVKGQEKIATFIEGLESLTKRNPDLAKKYDLLEIKDKCFLLHEAMSSTLKEDIKKGLRYQDTLGQAQQTVLGLFNAIINNPEKISEKEKTYEEPLKIEVARLKDKLNQQLYPGKTIH